MTIVTPPPAIDRDRYGRPMVVPPNGGKPQAYSRCTSYIDVLEDKYNLQLWMQRMVALGLADRPDLLLSVAAHRDDKKKLNKVVEDAREAAAASAAATTGTALHALTELVDRGETLPVLPPGPKASLDAYEAATTDLRYSYIEQFCVLDTLKIGGTPDRIGAEIFDVKTGSIEWGYLKIAMQLAVYSRSWVYDVASRKRSPHGASTTEATVIHLPAVDDPTEARCDLYTVDIALGWEAVQVATEVRRKRKYKFTDLMHPRGSTGFPSSAEIEAESSTMLLGLIAACATADAVRDLWGKYEAIWTDEHTAAAKAHITDLPTVA